jgi:hypothetical protein
MNPVNFVLSHFFIISFNINFQSIPRPHQQSLFSRFSDKYFTQFPISLCVPDVLSISYSLFMNPHIMKLSPASCHFLYHRFRYFHQEQILKLPLEDRLFVRYTECGKLTSFFIWIYSYIRIYIYIYEYILPHLYNELLVLLKCWDVILCSVGHMTEFNKTISP